MSESFYIVKEELRELIVARSIWLDVRSEGEFEDGVIPGAVNVPLLTNDERSKVGICYQERGQEAAVQLGNQLVSGAKRADRIREFQKVAADPRFAGVFCARGGLRSQITCEWLAEQGIRTRRVYRGYKALRGVLSQEVDSVQPNGFIVLCGRTGSGKSAFLRKQAFYNNVLDLESLARHNGSAFGSLFRQQPAQGSFENFLGARLCILGSAPLDFLMVEDESNRIGNLQIPGNLYACMEEAKRIVLEADEDVRIANILQEYIISPTDSLQDEVAGITFEKVIFRLQESICGATLRIQKRLGGERTKQCLTMIQGAFAEQLATGNVGRHAEWIRFLLTEYYDPYYDYGMEKQKENVLCRANADVLEEFLKNYKSSNRRDT